MAASSEWRVANSNLEGQAPARLKFSAHQEMRPPVKIHFTSRQVAAIYALRITLYDTNLFVADATPTRKRQRIASGE
jgi:hypothetical protein